MNYILINYVTKITKSEKHTTKTDHYISLARKLAIAQFFNSSLITLVISTYALFTEERSNYGKIFGSSKKYFLFFLKIFSFYTNIYRYN